MPKFPTTEADILVLAQQLKSGLAAHAAVYPEPPVLPADLTAAVTALQAAMEAATNARAAAEAATAQKLAMLTELVNLMKKDLRYAENEVSGNDEQLKLLGWGGRKEPEPVPAPGQVRSLVVYPQGEGWLDLKWQTPMDGGKVAMYRVLRRRRTPGSVWEQAASTMERTVSLQNQPRGAELEYVVVATNKAGDGLPSNTVMVVL